MRYWTGLSYVEAQNRAKRHGWQEVGWRSMGATLYYHRLCRWGLWISWGGIIDRVPKAA